MMQPAGEIICYNYDLLAQILEHLPLKTLLRFKSVSKAWLSLISSRPFSLLWLHHHGGPKISGFFFTSDTTPRFKKYIPLTLTKRPKSLCKFPNMQVDGSTKVIQSSNGLLLCKLRTCYQVYNPTTKQFSNIPWPSSCRLINYHVYLAFDLSRSLHYKVVLLQGSSSGKRHRVHIYSSETKAWRVVGGNRLSIPSMCLERGVYCNGSIHWISCHQNVPSLYFDVDQERAGSLPPLPFRVSPKFRHFFEFRGRLYVISECINYPRTYFELAEMEPDYSKWSFKYRVDLTKMVDFVLSHDIMAKGVFCVLGLVPGDEDGDMGWVILVGTDIIMSHYNLKDNTFKKFHHVAYITDTCPRDRLLPRGCREFPSVFSHIETLFPV